MNEIPPIIEAILLHPEDADAIREYVQEYGVEALESDEPTSSDADDTTEDK